MAALRCDDPFRTCSVTQPQFITLSRKSSTSSEDLLFENLATGEIEVGLRTLKSELGDGHPDVAVALGAVGDACAKNGDYDEALRFHQEALTLRQKNGNGKSDPSVGDTMFAIGELHKERNSLDDSLEQFKDALSVFETYLTQNGQLLSCSERTAIFCKIMSTKNSMGSIKFQQQMFGDALEDYHCALDRAKHAIGVAENSALIDSMEDNPAEEGEQPFLECVWVQDTISEIRMHLADTLSNIASVHAERSEWGPAISRFNEALEIQMVELGEDDPEVANTLMNVGTMNFRFGNLSLALKAYKQAWKMRQNILGPSHVDVSDALLNVALVHDRMGNTDRAESSYASALRVAKHSVGDKHMKVATLKNSLANIFLRTGREELAVQFFSEVWTIYKLNGLDDEHHLVKAASKNIAEIRCKNQDDMAAVLTAFHDVLNFFSQMGVSTFSLDDPRVNSFLKNVTQASTPFSMAVC